MKNIVMPRVFSSFAVLAAAVFGGVPGPAAAQALRQPPTPAERAYAVRVGWSATATQLDRMLRAAYLPGHGGAAGSVGNPAFQSWLLLQRWAELLARSEPAELDRFLGSFFVVDPAAKRGLTFVPPGFAPPAGSRPISPAELEASSADREGVRLAFSRLLPAGFSPGAGTVADGLKPEFLAAMAGDEAFLRAFFGNLSERDCVPVALRALQDIWLSAPTKWPEYRNLAVALALVRDQRPPSWWPHRQVRPADVPRGEPSPAEAFRFWVAANDGRRLYSDLRRLAVEELKFVIDAPVAAGELEWAQANARFPRADYGRAFRAIPYRIDRIASQTYSWNEGPYTLAAIRERGGICVDQAYFAMLSGKAHGLPTLYFTGQGTDGGHAWFGYLKGENRWDMDCGRYENQNYAVGEALDPQTWLPINDHELLALAQSFRRTPAYLASQADLAMARLFRAAGEAPRELAALDSAVSVCPRNDTAWAAKGDFLERTGAASTVRRDFHEAAIKQFANNEDLKVGHQRALAALARGGGDETAAQAIEASIISQNRRTRSDLSVDAAASRLSGLVDAKKFADAMTEYRNLLGRLGRTGGGDFFYEIVEPFARSLAAHGDPASARRAVDLARNALRPDSGSILDQDLTALGERVAGPASGSR